MIFCFYVCVFSCVRFWFVFVFVFVYNALAIEKMFALGLSKQLLRTLTKLHKNIPSLKILIQDKLNRLVTAILTRNAKYSDTDIYVLETMQNKNAPSNATGMTTFTLGPIADNQTAGMADVNPAGMLQDSAHFGYACFVYILCFFFFWFVCAHI